MSHSSVEEAELICCSVSVCSALCPQQVKVTGGEGKEGGGGDRRFHSEFPSLEEQETMSKRELEELQRERREREGDREHSPVDRRPPPERNWGDHPPGPMHGPPHGNAPPFPRYPPPHYGPYMMPPVRHGGELCSLIPHRADINVPLPPRHSSPLWRWPDARRVLPSSTPPDGLRSLTLPPLPAHPLQCVSLTDEREPAAAIL